MANRCLTNSDWGFTWEQKRLFKQQLITAVYGGVDSIPDAAVAQAINNYSSRDIAIRFAIPYLDKFPRPENLYEGIRSNQWVSRKEEEYIQSYPHKRTNNGRTIIVRKCATEGPPLIEGDHAFLDKTYQLALKDDLALLDKKWRIIE